MVAIWRLRNATSLFASSLGTDAGHAGDVVGRVAHQPQVVDELVGCDAVLLLHALGVEHHHVADALLGVDDAGEPGRQLAGVLVAGDQQRAEAKPLVAGRDGAQDVVALPAGAFDHGHVHRREQLLHDGELQLVVHVGPLRLVLGKFRDAVDRLALVEGAHHRVGRRLLHELAEHLQEAEHRVGRRAVLRSHRRLDGVVRPVHQGVAVDDGDRLFHGASRD